MDSRPEIASTPASGQRISSARVNQRADSISSSWRTVQCWSHGRGKPTIGLEGRARAGRRGTPPGRPTRPPPRGPRAPPPQQVTPRLDEPGQHAHPGRGEPRPQASRRAVVVVDDGHDHCRIGAGKCGGVVGRTAAQPSRVGGLGGGTAARAETMGGMPPGQGRQGGHEARRRRSPGWWRPTGPRPVVGPAPSGSTTPT